MIKAMEQLKANKSKLQNDIRDLLVKFEKENGADIIELIDFARYNGSNNAFGEIRSVAVKLIM